MNRTISIAVATAAVALLAACESSPISSPSTPSSPSFARGGQTASCTITLPAPVNRPLPAVRETARELNEAFGRSDATVNCGTINGISQRLNTLISKIDQPDGAQNFDAACGIGGSLVNQLQEMVANGEFNPIVTHDPAAGPNVVDNMAFIESMFCQAAGH
jgi:ABC-type glycerol-3-phosphate transport system substrate-binding protein